jgi:hypothetical protein
MTVKKPFLLDSPDTIEGVGSARMAAMESAGIDTIADMFVAGAHKIHKICDGAGARQVGDWFCAAAIRQVKGITPDLAEAFVNKGVRSVRQLADAGLKTLEDAVEEAVGNHQMSAAPSVYKLAELQREAWKVRDCGMLAGKVLDASGEPIAGAIVDVGRYEMETGADGRYAFDRLSEGEVDIQIYLPGSERPMKGRSKPIAGGKLTAPVVHAFSDPPDDAFSVPVLHEMDGHRIVHTTNTISRMVYLPLDQFRSGTYFLVREISSGGTARLLSLYKVRKDRFIIIERAKVDAADLPPGSTVGSVLSYENGMLASTQHTPSDIAAMKTAKWRASLETTTRHIINV